MTRVSGWGWRLAWPVLVLAMQSVAGREPDVVLSGVITGADHRSLLELPFLVPRGTRRITVDFTYDRTATTVDLGLADPQRFRGWSGGNKRTFTLAETDATASYLPGPLPPGRWRLLLGVPHAAESVASRFRAVIHFGRDMQTHALPFAPAPLATDAGWYRGDLHAHSGHSDGTCAASSGDRVPCPVYRTVQAAAARGLHFLALTDHNTRSHHQSLRELQAAFDGLVLLPGVEVTTFRGHAGIIGTTAFIDFVSASGDMNALLAGAAGAGGLISINHPGLPSDERCMGCGWTAETDYALVDAVEVVNGGALRAADGVVRGPLSGIPFWESLLTAGWRVTAVGGSDNHDPDLPTDQHAAVGRPATVVHARELSQPALLDGIRAGRVFLDVDGSADRLLDLTACTSTASAGMGDELIAPAGTAISVTVAADKVPHADVVLIRDGAEAATAPTDASAAARLEFRLDGRPGRGWIRAEVRSPAGRTLLLSNPIYLVGPEE